MANGYYLLEIKLIKENSLSLQVF